MFTKSIIYGIICKTNIYSFEGGAFMILIVCLDDRNGMLFNNRRQSRDDRVITKILEITHSSKLWMNNFSQALFQAMNNKNLQIDDDFLHKAGTGEYCFAENVDPSSYEDQIEKIYIFRWNRHYPSDFYFTLSLSKYKLIASSESMGSSHEKITLEVYEK